MQNNRNSLLMAFSLIILCSLFFCSVFFGGTPLSAAKFFYSIMEVIQNNFVMTDANISSRIFLEVRLPRTLIAAVAGSCLSYAGVLSQGLFRNPLASPSVLGSTSGGVLFSVFCFCFSDPWNHWYLIPLASFFGVMTVTAFFILISVKIPYLQVEILLLMGFSIATLVHSISSFLIAHVIEDPYQVAAITQWMMGGFHAANWTQTFVLTCAFITALYFSKKIPEQLDILTLGEDVCKTLGINLLKLRLNSILVMSILTGSVISICGLIPFVGLITPHISRRMIGAKNKNLCKLSIINGACLTIFADLLARTVYYPEEIQVGILTSFIGAFFFLWILTQRINYAA